MHPTFGATPHCQLTAGLIDTDNRCRVRIEAGVAICAPEATGWIRGSGVVVAIEPATQIVLAMEPTAPLAESDKDITRV